MTHLQRIIVILSVLLIAAVLTIGGLVYHYTLRPNIIDDRTRTIPLVTEESRAEVKTSGDTIRLELSPDTPTKNGTTFEGIALANHSLQTIFYYTGCETGLILYRVHDDGLSEVMKDASLCLGNSWVVPLLPGQTAVTRTWTLQETLPAGTYQLGHAYAFKTSGSYLDRTETYQALSDPFTIE